MDLRINRLEEKLDSKLDLVVEKLHDINITLIRNTQSLEVHEQRTDIAEKRLDSYEDRLEKVASFHKTINLLVFKIIPALAAIVAFAYKVGLFNRFTSA